MNIVHAPLKEAINPLLKEVVIHVERRTLAKRLWRARATDGLEFGFELQEPLRHRDVIHVTELACYRIRQAPEALLAVKLGDNPELAALAGWTAGNMHCPVAISDHRLLAADEKGLRTVFDKAGINYTESFEIFQPSASSGTHTHGHSHSHAQEDGSTPEGILNSEHKHTHPQGHTHSHPPAHSPGHEQSHTHEHGHEHGHAHASGHK